jgi:hypothetical protein
VEDRSAPRDFGLSWTAATALAGFAIFVAGSRWPSLLWQGSIGNAAILVGAIAVAAALLGTFFFRKRHVMAEASAATIFTLVAYAGVQGGAYYISMKEWRHATQVASHWRVLDAQDYSHKVFGRGNIASSFGSGRASIENGKFYLSIDSTRDLTLLSGPDVAQPIVRDFLAQVDVDYVQGPEDGFCTLIFGESSSGNNWWAFKLGPRGLGVTRDVHDQLPHHRIYGITPSSLAHDGVNHLAVLKVGQEVELFVNKRHLTTLHNLDVPAGRVWLAPQAANTPDQITCAYDNFELQGTAP